ncbi:MAG: hypothetical protein V3V29_06625, partial [Acidimicrobiia bacterium]
SLVESSARCPSGERSYSGRVVGKWRTYQIAQTHTVTTAMRAREMQISDFGFQKEEGLFDV